MSTDANYVQSTSAPTTGEVEARRSRLKDRSPLAESEEGGADQEERPDVEALRALVAEVDGKGTAFQSVAVAAVKVLEQALVYERDAADAALSLGQREKLQAMVDTAEEAVRVLRSALSVQGAKVMHLCGGGDPSDRSSSPSGQPWWFALTDALEVLEEGTGRMSSLTTAQPDGSPARRLSQLITQLLRGHHDALLLEADEWIS